MRFCFLKSSFIFLDLLFLSLVFTEINLVDVVIKQIESVSKIIKIASFTKILAVFTDRFRVYVTVLPMLASSSNLNHLSLNHEICNSYPVPQKIEFINFVVQRFKFHGH